MSWATREFRYRGEGKSLHLTSPLWSDPQRCRIRQHWAAKPSSASGLYDMGHHRAESIRGHYQTGRAMTCCLSGTLLSFPNHKTRLASAPAHRDLAVPGPTQREKAVKLWGERQSRSFHLKVPVLSRSCHFQIVAEGSGDLGGHALCPRHNILSHENVASFSL